MLPISNTVPANFSEEERQAAHQQLQKLLANPIFSQSRRFPQFLRFIVEQTISGNGDMLKERTLGVEVFGKKANYDTATDPIVRVTAAELRKRIALYYQQPGHESEMRLTLPPGSYIPHFDWPQAASEPPSSAVALSIPTATPEMPPVGAHTISGRHSHHVYWAAGVVLIAILLAMVFVWRSSGRSPLDAFWGPVLNSSDPVLFCVADQTQYTDIALRDAADPSHQNVLHDNLTAVVIDDLSPIVKIAGILQAKGKKYTLQGEGATTMADLQNGPTIFIGAYDNAWTLRLLRPLRYHFGNNPGMTRFFIVDSKSPSPTPWVVDRTQQIATNIYRDYGIVARFTDSDTGKLAIVVAGIGRGGTIGGGELVTDPALLAQIKQIADASKKKNLELVLSTQIIGGQPGTPRIEASYTW